MITITEIKEIKNKWLQRRVISHQEIGELLDFGFQLHLDTEQKLKEIFNDFYLLLDGVAEQAQDTLWYNSGTTAHERLVHLAYKYRNELGEEFEDRLEKDCGFEKV